MKVKVAQSCLTLCDPMDYTAHGILQARILECVAFPFSRGIFPTQTSNPGFLHCRRILYQLSHKGSPRILEGVAYPFSSGSSQARNLTRVFLHCRQILYQLSYEGRSLGWEDPLEKGKATHSSILARRIPWTVVSVGSQRVRHG